MKKSDKKFGYIVVIDGFEIPVVFTDKQKAAEALAKGLLEDELFVNRLEGLEPGDIEDLQHVFFHKVEIA